VWWRMAKALFETQDRKDTAIEKVEKYERKICKNQRNKEHRNFL
jgi:hypothetical protein